MNGNGNGKKGAKPSTNAARANRRRGNNGGTNGGTMYQMATTQPVRPLAWASDNTRLLNNKVYSHSGSDFVTTVTVVAQPNSPADRILAVFPISPSSFPGTRLTQFSSLYEFYKFSSLRLRYVPAVPVTLACQFVLYVDLDPTDDPTSVLNPDSLIRQATAQTGSMQWNFHTPKNIPMAMRTDQQYYFTGKTKQNERFTLQGKAYLIQVTDPVNFNGEPLSQNIVAGSIYFDWTCRFNIPQLNPDTLTSNSTSQQTLELGVDVTGQPVSPFDILFIDANDNPLLAPETEYMMVVDPSSATSDGSPNFGSGIVQVNDVNAVTMGFPLGGSTVQNFVKGSVYLKTDIRGIPEQVVTISVNSTRDYTGDYTLWLKPLRGGKLVDISSSGPKKSVIRLRQDRWYPRTDDQT